MLGRDLINCKKHIVLNKSLERFAESNEADSMEFILHVAKNKIKSRRWQSLSGSQSFQYVADRYQGLNFQGKIKLRKVIQFELNIDFLSCIFNVFNGFAPLLLFFFQQHNSNIY
mgnify:CR=1 FL=1